MCTKRKTKWVHAERSFDNSYCQREVISRRILNVNASFDQG